jgi:hypothetical protein
VDAPFGKVGVSTFTHLGRHAWTLKTCIAYLREAPKLVADIGCGVLEPFLLAECVTNRFSPFSGLIHAVDINEDYIDLIHQLILGASFPVNNMTNIAHDTDLLGHSIPNSNFIDRLWVGIRDYQDAKLDIDVIFDPRSRSFRYTGIGSKVIKPIHSDINPYLSLNIENGLTASFDLIYIGALIVNLLKVHTPTYVQNLLVDMYQLLSKNGLLAIGTSPSALYGEPTELFLLHEAQFSDLFISIENVIIEDYQTIFGDYAIVASKDDQFYLDKFQLDQIETRVTQDRLLNSMQPEKRIISYDDLITHLRTDRESLLLCAVRLPHSKYLTWHVKKDKLLNNKVFRERYLFNLIRR